MECEEFQEKMLELLESLLKSMENLEKVITGGNANAGK